MTALVSKTTANKDAKIQAVCGLASRKMAGNTTVINVAGKDDVSSVMSAATSAPGSKGVVVMSCVNISSATTARQMTDNGAVELLQQTLIADISASGSGGASGGSEGGSDSATETKAGGKAAVETLKNLIHSTNIMEMTQGQTKEELEADKSCISSKMRDLKIAASIAAALRQSDDPEFSNDCISLLQDLTSMMGEDEDGCGLDEESLNLIMQASTTSGADQDGIDNLMHSLAATSDLARSMVSVGGTVDDAKVDSQLEDTLKQLTALTEVTNVQEVLDPTSGKSYYVNIATNETSWEKPKELKTLERNIDTLVDMCEVRGKEIKEMDTQLAEIMKAVETHSDKQEVVTKLITVMNSLALNPQNCIKIAETGGIATVLRALHKSVTGVGAASQNGVTHPGLATIIIQCLKLISRFAINDRFKRSLCEANAVELVNHAVKSCLDIDKISQHGVSCLGNMAFNFSDGVTRMVNCGVIKTLESVLQKWIDNAPVCEVTLVTMSNLMFRNDPVKETLGLTCGDEVVEVVKTLASNTKVVIAAMRALGNLASLETNVMWMLENGAVSNLVFAMEHPANLDKHELVQTAIDVIGNLAAVEGGDEEHLDNDGDDSTAASAESKKKSAHMAEIHQRIMAQGGVRGIIEAMKGPCSGDGAVLMSSLETLASLSGVETLIVSNMIPLGLLEIILDTMKQYDWDSGIMERATGLIVALSYFEDCVDDLADLGVMDVLVQCMEQHEENHEILQNVQVSFTNMSINFEEQEHIVNHGALDAMLVQLTKKPEGDATEEQLEQIHEHHLEIITTLTRIACTDEFSGVIGTKGMSEILGTYEVHVGMDLDGTLEYIAALLTLVSQLAFHQENLKYVMQCNGVKHAIAAAEKYADDSEVVLHALQVVDNCGTASADLAHMVESVGGTQLFDAVIQENRFEDCVDTAKSAKLGIQAMIRSTQTIKISASGKKVSQKNMLGHLASQGEEKGNDPMGEHRGRLLRGNVFAHWGEGGQRFVYCTPDFTSIAWKKNGATRAKDIKSVLIDNVVEVREGARSGGHKKGTKTAHDDRAFSIVVKDGNKTIYIDLEASTPVERDRWVEAVQTVVECVKNGTV